MDYTKKKIHQLFSSLIHIHPHNKGLEKNWKNSTIFCKLYMAIEG